MRRGTAAEWTAADPTLANGEWGLETDTGKFKIGTGSAAWEDNGFDYSSLPSTAITTTVIDAVGDILYGSADNTANNLTVGTNNHVLTADSSVSNVGIKWAAPAVPTTVTVAADTSDTTCFPGLFTAASGDLLPKTDATLTYDASNGTLGATTFSGALTGNVTGTIQTAAQGNITSVGTLGSLAVTGAVTAGSLVAPLAINALNGTTYTFVLADAGKLVTSSNGSEQTLTVPPTGTGSGEVPFPIGTQIIIQNIGTANATLAEGTGVDIFSKDDNKEIDGQYAAATLIQTATSDWSLIGALA
jgi:hypothetical protein